MELRQALLDAGFSRVIALDAAEVGLDGEGTLLLALWFYGAEETPDPGCAWIHPYYFASQQAYRAASEVVKHAQAAGEEVQLSDDTRVKPIFARLPGFSQGRNTLSYLPGVGSRFHVQLLWTGAWIMPDLHLEDAPHPLQCGDCRACLDACPTGALDEAGFHRERCLRNWMLSGKAVPEELRGAMGSRLIGCDTCQRCCPHNDEPAATRPAAVTLAELLEQPKEASLRLWETIGANLALPNRVLAQSCLLAGNARDAALAPMLSVLTQHPSPVVAEHAAWALTALAESAGENAR